MRSLILCLSLKEWADWDGVHDTGKDKSYRLSGVLLEMRHQTLPDQGKAFKLRDRKDTRGSARFRPHGPWMPWERSWSVLLVSRENNINGSHLVLWHLAEMERNTSEMWNQRPEWHQGLIWNLRPLQSSPGQVLSVLQSQGSSGSQQGPRGTQCLPGHSEDSSQMQRLGSSHFPPQDHKGCEHQLGATGWSGALGRWGDGLSEFTRGQLFNCCWVTLCQG